MYLRSNLIASALRKKSGSSQTHTETPPFHIRLTSSHTSEPINTKKDEKSTSHNNMKCQRLRNKDKILYIDQIFIFLSGLFFKKVQLFISSCQLKTKFLGIYLQKESNYLFNI